PVGSAQILAPDPGTGWFAFNAKFSTLATLDGAAPAGKYTFSLNTAHDGLKTLTLTLPASEYPSAPHVKNFQVAQTIDPARPFTVNWDPLDRGTTNDFVLVLVGDTAKTTVLYRNI